MNPNTPKVPGEASIPQPVQQTVSPDVQSEQGQQLLFHKAIQANAIKPVFEAVLKKIASNLNADASTRVKQIETMSAKIAQKRMQGREYGIGNLNDDLGGRIILDKKTDLQKAIKQIQELDKIGFLNIKQSQDASHKTYGAWHIDGKLVTGVPFEIQIMTKKQEAESLVNHGLRAVHGEEVEGEMKELRDKQADIVKKLPDKKVEAISTIVKNIAKERNNRPIPPQVTMSLLQQAK